MALARDGFLPAGLASVNRYGSPRVAGNIVMVCNLVLLAALAAWHDNASDLYGYTGTVATLAVLIAYGMMSIASLIRFTKADIGAGKPYLVVPPVLGLLIAGYSLFANVYPVPAYPFNLFPYIVLAYMVIGVGLMVASRQRTGHADITQFQFGEEIRIEEARS